MGLDVYLNDGPEVAYDTNPDEWERQFKETQEIKSSRYPDHMCGPRYLRSSYNSAGFNSVVGDLVEEDLYSVFLAEESEYPWFPSKEHLASARGRAVDLVHKLEKVERPLAATDICSFGGGTNSKAEAVKITKEKLDVESMFDAFSCSEGFFSKKGLTIYAAIPGHAYGQATTYLVHAIDLEWYIQMAEIVVEFIDCALAMDNPRITWSG